MTRHRGIGISRKIAWLTLNRIREEPAADKADRFSGPVGVDETV